MAKKSKVSYKHNGKPTKKDPIKSFVNIFKSTAKLSANKASKELATILVNNVKYVIENQKYNWKPLSPSYVIYKEVNNLDPRIFIATGYYLQSINARPIHSGSDIIGYRVGVPNRQHPDSDINMITLAKMLEFGTSKMPARPHWRPTWAAFIDNLPKYKKIVKKHIAEGLKRKK